MAEALFRSVSEAEVPQEQITSKQYQEQDKSNASKRATARSKRAQVSAACQFCRQRRMKCDASRPCNQCKARNITCEYATADGETHTQATKRKLEAVSKSNDVYAELFDLLTKTSEREAMELFRRIRGGQRPDAFVKFAKTGAMRSIVLNPSQHALQAFLISLAHSTGSLRDVAKLAFSTLESSAIDQLPHGDEFRVLYNRIVHLQDVESILKRSKLLGSHRPLLLDDGNITSTKTHGGSQLDIPSNASDLSSDLSKHGHTPHRVPAAPWTDVDTSDEAISHLVSVFLTWLNPTWRFVEQDLFLLGMRSKRLDSDLCSPLLVNSICAIASLQSEHEVAFLPNDSNRQRITRGQHFRDEALRLWLLEENRPTLTNVQALCVLALDSNYRAKDRFGLSLAPIATQMDAEIPVDVDEKRCANQGISEKDFTRLRVATHWTAKCTSIILRIAFLQGVEAPADPPALPRILEVFDVSVVSWSAYPLDQTDVAHSPTLYIRERCSFANLMKQVPISVLRHEGQSQIREFADTVDHLFAEMQHWYQHLPYELYYQWPMTGAVWELHASYLSVSMVLCLQARTRFQQDEPPLDGTNDEDATFRSDMAQRKLYHAISLAHRAAQILKEFREHYGLKITPSWLLHLQATTSGVLLLDPALKDSAAIATSPSQDIGGEINDSHTAFDEVFRSLLGSSVEVMVARGIARMMYHSALERNIALGPSSRQMLRIMSETGWHHSNLASMSSVLPNFASIQGRDDRERMTELLEKWEKLEV